MESEIKLVNVIREVLTKKGWNINSISVNPLRQGSGLLNKPVQRCIVEHDGQTSAIAIKVQERDPFFLFRDLYQGFGHASASQMEDFEACCSYLSIREMKQRERFFYQYHNSEIEPYIPVFYGMINKNDDEWFLLMEDLSYCRNMDKVNWPEAWGVKDIALAAKTLAIFHNMEIYPKEFLIRSDRQADYDRLEVFLETIEQKMIAYSGIKRIPVVDDAVYCFIFHLEEYERKLRQYGKKVIHHDFNIRNICIDEKNCRLKVYDWEFSDYENPIMDFIDLFLELSSRLLNKANLDQWLTIYINESMRYGADRQTLSDLKEQLYYNVLKYAATRMNLYFLYYTGKKVSYIERIYSNLYLLLKYCKRGTDVL